MSKKKSNAHNIPGLAPTPKTIIVHIKAILQLIYNRFWCNLVKHCLSYSRIGEKYALLKTFHNSLIFHAKWSLFWDKISKVFFFDALNSDFQKNNSFQLKEQKMEYAHNIPNFAPF